MERKQSSSDTRETRGTGNATIEPARIQEEIRTLAYQLFRECGCEYGHDLHHWLEAEQRVLAQAKGKRRQTA